MKNNDAVEMAKAYWDREYPKTNSNGWIVMAQYAQEQAAAAVNEANAWTKWDWNDATTWPSKDGEYICNDGYSDLNSYAIDTWDSSRKEFIHYQIYGFWRLLPTVEHEEFAAEIAKENNDK